MGSGLFVIAVQRGRHLGCGAVRRIDARTAELKRMYVRPEARNRGVAREILRALEGEARELGIARLVLETGVRQLAAMALYRREGYAEIAPFGEYVNSPRRRRSSGHSPALSACCERYWKIVVVPQAIWLINQLSEKSSFLLTITNV